MTGAVETDVTTRAGNPAEERQAELQRTMVKLQAGIEALRTNEGWRSWLDFASRMPTYSLNNQLLIITQKPAATAVAGYAAWRAQGRHVRRGETGIRILAPVTRPIRLEESADGLGAMNGEDVRGTTRRVLAGFRVASVFDVSQTEGAPLPTPPRPTLLSGQAPDGLWEDLEAQIRASGFALGRVPTAEAIGGANGVTDFGARTVKVRSDVSPAQAVKTLAHELGHVHLHDPKRDPLWSMPCREVKEVEAESVAYVVTAYAGLDASEYTFGYVAGWAEGRTDEEMTVAADRVLQTARVITDGIDLPRDPSTSHVPTATLRQQGPTCSSTVSVVHREPLSVRI